MHRPTGAVELETIPSMSKKPAMFFLNQFFNRLGHCLEVLATGIILCSFARQLASFERL